MLLMYRAVAAGEISHSGLTCILLDSQVVPQESKDCVGFGCCPVCFPAQ